jgi:hypothetical protein
MLSGGVFETIDPLGSVWTGPWWIGNDGENVNRYDVNTGASQNNGYLLSGGEYSTVDVRNTTCSVVADLAAIAGAFESSHHLIDGSYMTASED